MRSKEVAKWLRSEVAGYITDFASQIAKEVDIDQEVSQKEIEKNLKDNLNDNKELIKYVFDLRDDDLKYALDGSKDIYDFCDYLIFNKIAEKALKIADEMLRFKMITKDGQEISVAFGDMEDEVRAKLSIGRQLDRQRN